MNAITAAPDKGRTFVPIQKEVVWVFSTLSLSSKFQQRLEVILLTKPRYLTLLELRSLPPRAALRRLLSIRGRSMLLTIEEENSFAFLPYLTTIAAFTWVKEISVVGPDLRVGRRHRISALASIARIAFAGIRSQRAVRQASRELTELTRLPRQEMSSAVPGRVLFVKPSVAFGAPVGGSVAHAIGVAEGLARNFGPVDFIAPHGPGPTKENVKYIPLDLSETAAIPQEAHYYRLHGNILREGRSVMCRESHAFVYARLTLGGYSGVVLARDAAVPLVLEYNCSEVWGKDHWDSTAIRYRDIAMMAEKACLKHAHLVVTVSEVLREELLNRGIEAHRIVCHPNGVNPDIFNPARFDAAARRRIRMQHGIGPDATLVTFVGTFGKWHGVDILAEVIRDLLDTDPRWVRQQRAHFMFVGDGMLMPQIRQMLDYEQYKHAVTFTGLIPQEEAPAYLATSDVLVASHVRNSDGSRFFGSPTKLFEYMAMGKGIVASRLDQIADVLQPALSATNLPDGKPGGGEEFVGVLAEPGNAQELAQGLRFLVQESEWRAVMGANAREKVLDRYTWDRHVEAILSGLDALRRPEAEFQHSRKETDVLA